MKRWLIGIAVAGALVIPGAQAVGARQERPSATRTYTIRPGETVWAIARSLAPERDPRGVVAGIVAMNRLGSSALLPGQKIRIPVLLPG